MRQGLTVILTACAAITACVCGCTGNDTPRPETGSFTLAPGDTASLSQCYVRADTEFNADIRCDGQFKGITMRRGSLSVFLGSELRLTPDSMVIRRYGWVEELGANAVTTTAAVAHGLDIGTRLKVEIATASRTVPARVSVTAGGRKFSMEVPWDGGGCPSVTNDGDGTMRVRLSFLRGAACEKIWFLGDSYFSETDPERWAYYMVREGFANGWMADHLPGGSSETFIECFRNDLKYGKPEVAVWMLGMNDRDSGKRINRDWLACFEEFCSLCDQHGITPVICTIPTVPERNHGFKNAVVRESGRRIVDWAAAVGAKPWGSEDMDWTEGMLSPDGIHPAASGAQALWETVRTALPELGR